MADDRIVWDAHSCLPLDAGINFSGLSAHQKAGFDFVSINVGMDPTDIGDILKSIAYFRDQIRRLPEQFALCGTVSEVRSAKAAGRLAVAFDLEGSVFLYDRPEMVRLFADLGVRQMHLAYNLNNSIAGGCLDEAMPLTPLGREVLRTMNEVGMIVDCSHNGARTTFDIMERSAKPVVFSHANVRALADVERNVTDDQIRACAATGGVVGICAYNRFLRVPPLPPAIEDMATHIEHVANLVGIDHVGIGWDYSYDHENVPLARDKAVIRRYFPWASEDLDLERPLEESNVPIDRLPFLEPALADRGFSDRDVAKVLGGNFLRVAEATWPKASD